MTHGLRGRQGGNLMTRKSDVMLSFWHGVFPSNVIQAEALWVKSQNCKRQVHLFYRSIETRCLSSVENRSLFWANIKSDNSRKQSLTYSSASGTKVTFVHLLLKPWNRSTRCRFLQLYSRKSTFSWAMAECFSQVSAIPRISGCFWAQHINKF